MSRGDIFVRMNEQVRQMVKARMKERGITQVKLAQEVGMEQPNIQRLLAGRVGAVPESWQKVLDALGLELVAQNKEGQP